MFVFFKTTPKTNLQVLLLILNDLSVLRHAEKFLAEIWREIFSTPNIIHIQSRIPKGVGVEDFLLRRSVTVHSVVATPVESES